MHLATLPEYSFSFVSQRALLQSASGQKSLFHLLLKRKGMKKFLTLPSISLLIFLSVPTYGMILFKLIS
jgi:hypothetical protein